MLWMVFLIKQSKLKLSRMSQNNKSSKIIDREVQESIIVEINNNINKRNNLDLQLKLNR